MARLDPVGFPHFPTILTWTSQTQEDISRKDAKPRRKRETKSFLTHFVTLREIVF
jgi:hypothetical protein